MGTRIISPGTQFPHAACIPRLCANFAPLTKTLKARDANLPNRMGRCTNDVIETSFFRSTAIIATQSLRS